MNDEIILESFVEESNSIAENIIKQLETLDAQSSEKDFQLILDNIKILKSNARIMEFVWLEKLCHSYEEILCAVITKNLFFTALINNFLVKVTKQIINHIEEIKKNKIENNVSLQNWIIDCDRIAAGMILDTETKKETESEKIQENRNIVISKERLNEMLKSFDDISTQRLRLKQQSASLEKYEEICGIEFSRLRKNISSTINDLENLLQNVQEQLLEAGMVNLYHTLNEFQIQNYAEKCKLIVEETTLVMDQLIAPHISKILKLFFQYSKEEGFVNIPAQKEPTVQISAKKNGPLIELTYKDNGNGINLENLRKKIILTFPQRKKEIIEMDEESLGMFLFTSGITSEQTVLQKAWKEIEEIKGKLKIHTEVGEGTTFTISFPKSLSSETGFIIKYGDSKYFIPANYVVESVSKTNKELITDTPKPYFEHRNQKIRTYRFSSILPNNSDSNESTNLNQDVNLILIIEYLEMKFGLIVDDVIGFSNKVVKPVPYQLKEIKEVEGIVIDENYDVIPVLNIPSFIKRFTWLRDYDLKRTEVEARRVVKNILVADSSLFARHIIRSIYENKGFFVEEANDGIEALEILKKKEISLVISALEMPRMNGLTLLDNIKRNQNRKDIPVILFPFEASEGEEKSYMEMGAKFVIKKNDFDRNRLINATKGFINE